MCTQEKSDADMQTLCGSAHRPAKLVCAGSQGGSGCERHKGLLGAQHMPGFAVRLTVLTVGMMCMFFYVTSLHQQVQKFIETEGGFAVARGWRESECGVSADGSWVSSSSLF